MPRVDLHVVQQFSQLLKLFKRAALLLFESAHVPMVMRESVFDRLEDLQQVRVALPFILRRSAQLRPGRVDALFHIRNVKYCVKYRGHRCLPSAVLAN